MSGKVPNMNPISRIYLTGFMGSGKSTLGMRLADETGFTFLDLDEEVENRLGMSIPEIFDRSGERLFRMAEAEALTASFRAERAVIAVGGGALVSGDAMEQALQHGLVVYLSATEETLRKRLQASDVERPLLHGGVGLKSLLESREPAYRRAHIVIPVDGLGVEDAVAALVEAIRSYSGTEGA